MEAYNEMTSLKYEAFAILAVAAPVVGPEPAPARKPKYLSMFL